MNYFFPKKVLDTARSKGINSLQCQQCFEKVSIVRLFEDTFAQELIESEIEAYKDEGNFPSTKYIIHGSVGSIIQENKGEVIQHIDQRTLIQELKPAKQLVEAEKEQGYITEEDYQELLDILEEIQEEYENPKPRQKKRWLRWLGKAGESGQKFLGDRMKKATDTVIQEEVKDWLKEGGLDALMEMIKNL